jgi:glycerol-3-phosphate dehydrogenase
VSHLSRFYPMSPRWTAQTALPGGDFPPAQFERQIERTRERWKFLEPDQARRLVFAYGSRVDCVLGEAGERAGLGEAFGPELTAAEVRYLMIKEWARFPDDILWRRSKLGLTMGLADRERLAAFMATVV